MSRPTTTATRSWARPDTASDSRARPLARRPAAAIATLLLAGWLPQDPPPQYTAAMLAEASFDQRVRAEVRTLAGGAGRTETIGREARLELRVQALGPELQFEAWFDSLLIWREGPEGRLTPDPDAIIGGRYRGVLRGDGRVAVSTRPFVPDALVEVTDVGGSLDDFFPPLPTVALPPGGVWERGGVRIVRRSDSTRAGETLWRFRWSRAQADTTREVTEDSLAYAVRSQLEEEGDLVWHRTLGPLVWHRRATVTMEIPADGAVRRSARTRMSEETWVWRRRHVP